MATETVYTCDATGDTHISTEHITTLSVKLPTPERGLIECGEIDIRSELLPDDFPMNVRSYNQNRFDTMVLCEGDRGLGGSTPYARIVALALPGKDEAHHQTIGRDQVIERFGEEVVDVIEQAVQNRLVAAQKQDEYPDAGL